MNCLPTAKIISGKSKNKYLPQATHKYEQRIRESKNKHDSQLICQNLQEIGKQHQNGNPYIDEWIRKRKEIDNWRKNVLFALQTETLNSTCSSNLSESQQEDSSTITTNSTLCSNTFNQKKEININNSITSPIVEGYSLKIQKSPSIPLFQSNSKTAMNGTNLINDSLYYNYYNRHSTDSKVSVVENDDFFAPSYSPVMSRHTEITSGMLSSPPFISPNFTESKYSNMSTGVCNNAQYTPVPVTKPTYLPTCYHNQKHEFNNDRTFEHGHGYQNCTPEYIGINQKNSIHYIQSHHINNFIDLQNSKTMPTKKTLHKNETNAKLVLKPSNSSYNDENQRSNSFFRTRSLNIKRSQEIADNESLNTEIKITFANTIYNNTENLYYSSDRKYSQYSRSNNNTDFNNTQSYRSKYIVLKPTFSQENVSYNEDHNFNKDVSIKKMNSYCNLQSKFVEIPKVPLYEPLTMKIVFKSEPTLFSN